MSSGTTLRVRRRREAKGQLAQLYDHPQNVLTIHYSCESFYDRPDGSSPRITSIAVRNLSSGLTSSFSIHQVAERDKKLNPEEIYTNYDVYERQMLDEFYDFVDRHKHCSWLHWNMRDINYGFAALAHRSQVLGGKSVDIPDTNLVDLARLLVGIYGVGYIGHPRLERLVEKNKITSLNFLSGKDEAQAFDQKAYVKLHQSTLRKVDILANIAERTVDGTLKTNARRKDIYGSNIAYAMELIKEHWIFVLIAFIGSVASIVGLALYLLYFKRSSGG